MIVHVTRRHILSGCRGGMRSCPIHAAITEALRERAARWGICVMETSLRFYEANDVAGWPRSFSIETPQLVAEAIARYDAIGEMEPFSFELDDAALAQLDQRAPVSAGRR